MRGPGRRERDAQPGESVASITDAAGPLSDDVAQRTRRYLVQMAIRTACLVGAVVVDHWTRWVLVVGAVVLPYTAVIAANAGQDRPSDPGTFLPPATPLALPGGATDPGAGPPSGPRP